MTNATSDDRGPSEEFLAHWNAVLVAGEDMALTLGLEPLSGDPSLVRVRMALTPAIRQPAGMFSAAVPLRPCGRLRHDVGPVSRARRHVPTRGAVVDLAGLEHDDGQRHQPIDARERRTQIDRHDHRCRRRRRPVADEGRCHLSGCGTSGMPGPATDGRAGVMGRA